MKNIAFLVSGGGHVIEECIKFCLKDPNLIPSLLLFREKTKTSQRLCSYDIPIKYINSSFVKHREEASNEILDHCNFFKIDYLICGFDRLLTGRLLKDFNKKIINIHPSALPEFKGLNAVDRQYDSNNLTWGCTTHYINKNMDEGQIIKQETCPIDYNVSKENALSDLYNLMCVVALDTLQSLIKK